MKKGTQNVFAAAAGAPLSYPSSSPLTTSLSISQHIPLTPPQDSAEHAMVRHEAAEALGAIGEERCLNMLREYAADPEPIVAHSCEVALDMLVNGEDLETV
jgi:hypothetical protein